MQLSEKEKYLLKVGEKLEKIRKENKYSNHEVFADELSMGRSQYRKYELGKTNLNIYTLKRILDKLNVSLEEFFSDGF